MADRGSRETAYQHVDEIGSDRRGIEADGGNFSNQGVEGG